MPKKSIALGTSTFAAMRRTVSRKLVEATGVQPKLLARRGIVEVRIGRRIAAVKTRELRKIIQLAEDAAQSHVLMKTVEISGIKSVIELGKKTLFPGTGQVYHAGQRVRAIENAIRATQHLNLIDCRW